MKSEQDDWTRRELPVLRAVVECEDGCPAAGAIRSEHLADEHLDSFEVAEVRLALKRLERGEYVWPPQGTRKSTSRNEDSVGGYTAQALTAVGAWPSDELALERLVTALNTAADRAEDPETQSAARKVAKYLMTSTNMVGLNVASYVLTGQLPGSS